MKGETTKMRQATLLRDGQMALSRAWEVSEIEESQWPSKYSNRLEYAADLALEGAKLLAQAAALEGFEGARVR